MNRNSNTQLPWDIDPKLTPAKIRANLKKNERERKRHLEEAKKNAKDRDERTQAKCVACGGTIMERFRKPPVHFDRNTPIGGRWDPDRPPSPAPHDGYHCGGCGIEYRALPRKKARQR